MAYLLITNNLLPFVINLKKKFGRLIYCCTFVITKSNNYVSQHESFARRKGGNRLVKTNL